MTDMNARKRPADPIGFSAVSRDAYGHFVLNIYAAIVALMDGLDRLFPLEDGQARPVADRVPFLKHYANEIGRIAPDHPDWRSLLRWWQAELTRWEAEASHLHLPLRDMIAEAGPMPQARLAFLLACLVEEDSRFGTLFQSLQAPLPGRRPTAEVIARIAEADGAGGVAAGWGVVESLLTAGFLRAEETDRARSEWTLAVPGPVWDAARSGAVPPSTAILRHLPAGRFGPVDALELDPETLARLRRVPRMPTPESIRLLILRSQPGSDAEQVAGALARAIGRDLLAAAPQKGKTAAALPLGPVATLCRAVPYLSFDLGPGETVPLPALSGYRGLVILSLAPEGSVEPPAGSDLVNLPLPVPSPALRRRLWTRLLPDTEPAELDAIAHRFRIGGGHIRRAAPMARNEAALDSRDTVTAADVRAAARALGRETLETHAVRMPETGAGWEGLICGSTTATKLNELERRCHHRETLPDHLGHGFSGNANRGVRALLTGTSGTGKTYASRILAAAVGRDLYRVDLASVINKYIGETEKNLHQVLAHAEALDVVLLLDEGDSLLGRRTDVKSSNDRYANLETNYLLQRLESYEGILIVTTNLGDAIDSAFQRRMDVVVPFQAPSAEERRRILTLHLPPNHAVCAQTLDRVAGSCQLTGAQVRNTVQHAGLLALDDGAGPIADRHLMTALASEYRKAGSVFPLAGQWVPPRHGGLEGFLAAMTGS